MKTKYCLNFILKKNQGFTLIEFIIIISIIGILGAIGVNRYLDLSHSANIAVCKSNQQHLITGQRLFWANSCINGKGQYALDINDLIPFMQTGAIPVCPEEGTYQIVHDEIVTCTINDHAI